MAFQWTCPFCDRDTTINDGGCQSEDFNFTLRNARGTRKFTSLAIVCPNPKCQKFTYSLSMLETRWNGAAWISGKHLQTWSLIPPSSAKIFPEYVPKPILDDYLEACAIRDLSPKASATIARRVLQGMIRDFWGISKARLIEEIEALKDKLDPLTWEAIDSIRRLGNIGAHMEKDIDLIIDVDPDEAQKLIELIELLIKDWYITRHERKERLASIVSIGEAKDELRKAASSKPE